MGGRFGKLCKTYELKNYSRFRTAPNQARRQGCLLDSDKPPFEMHNSIICIINLYCSAKIYPTKLMGNNNILNPTCGWGCADNYRIILTIIGSGENRELLEKFWAVSSHPTILIIVGGRFFVHRVDKMAVSSNGNDFALCFVLEK